MAPLHGAVIPLIITDSDTGTKLRMVWHSEPCAAEDPLHMRLADILSRDDLALTDTYEQLLERLRPYGLLTMQRAISIRRQPDDHRLTARAENVQQWGRTVRRR